MSAQQTIHIPSPEKNEAVVIEDEFDQDNLNNSVEYQLEETATKNNSIEEELLPSPQVNTPMITPVKTPQKSISLQQYVNPSSRQQEVALRKNSQKHQLRTMIQFKLNDKYQCKSDTNGEIGKLIKSELDVLFEKDNFDEWQLIDVDKKIKEKYLSFLAVEKGGSTIPQLHSYRQTQPDEQNSTLLIKKNLEDLNSHQGDKDSIFKYRAGKGDQISGLPSYIITDKAQKSRQNSNVRNGTLNAATISGDYTSNRTKQLSSRRSIPMSHRNFTSPASQNRDVDIFSQKSRKAVISNTTAEGNRLASLIIKEKANQILREPDQLKRTNSTQNKSIDPFSNKSNNFNPSRVDTASIADRQDTGYDNYMSSNKKNIYEACNQNMYLKEINTRRDDYWNKICLYNHKIAQLELQDKIKKKKRDQIAQREFLNGQLAVKQDNTEAEKQKDRDFIRLNNEKLAQEIETQKRKADDKKRKLQGINVERREHVQEKINDRNVYLQELKECQKDLENKDVSEIKKENDNQAKRRDTKTKAAIHNLDYHKQQQLLTKLQREAEKRQYCPKLGKEGMSIEVPSQSNLTPLQPIFSKTPKISLQDGTRRQVQDFDQTLRVPEHFGGKIGNIKDQQGFDDFMNHVFYTKRHQALDRRERADKRVEIISQNFNESPVFTSRAIPDIVTQQYMEKANKNFNDRLDRDKKDRYDNLLKTRDFQFAQMHEKKLDKSREANETKNELLDNVFKSHQFSRDFEFDMLNRKKLYSLHQNDLKIQIEQNKDKIVDDCKMNRTDMIFNRKLMNQMDETIPKGKKGRVLSKPY